MTPISQTYKNSLAQQCKQVCGIFNIICHDVTSCSLLKAEHQKAILETMISQRDHKPHTNQGKKMKKGHLHMESKKKTNLCNDLTRWVFCYLSKSFNSPRCRATLSMNADIILSITSNKNPDRLHI